MPFDLSVKKSANSSVGVIDTALHKSIIVVTLALYVPFSSLERYSIVTFAFLQ